METSWLEQSTDPRTQLSSLSLFLNADTAQFLVLLVKKVFFLKPLPILKSATYPVSTPPGKESTSIMFITFPTFHTNDLSANSHVK